MERECGRRKNKGGGGEGCREGKRIKGGEGKGNKDERKIEEAFSSERGGEGGGGDRNREKEGEGEGGGQREKIFPSYLSLSAN